MKLKIGNSAPDFTLLDKDEKAHTLSKVAGKYTVVYFYPKDNTPGCTLEAVEFTSNLNKLKKLGIEVIGISGGDAKSKTKFCSANDLKLTLLSDPDFKVCKKYGVYGLKKFMGREYMGIFRQTFLLDAAKKIVKIYEKVSPQVHAAEILADVKLLGK